MLLGTIVNMLAVIAGSLIGAFFKGGIPEKYNKTVMQAISLAVILVGIKGALKSDDLLVVIASLALGSLLGEFIGIENLLDLMGRKLESLFAKGGGNIAQGFVSATLIYCVGSMAIVGSLESGLTGNHATLFAKASLDGISAVFFTSTLGIGVLFSAVPILLYQGSITLAATWMQPYMVPEVVTQMSSVGGLLILAIGFNLLGLKKINVGNMLPSIFMPLIYFIVRSFF